MVALELLVFHEYFSGRSIPPWDFLSHYNTEAFAWWRDGSFFNPTPWMPYMWGGYPATLDLQNSSWYLPVGLMSAATTFDLHASATLSALHVGFGAVGMYVLGRRWGFARPAATLGLTGWFFVSGFYAHASHLDIMRGYAWIPWVLLCASPGLPWRRWWAPPLAGLVLWQGLLAMYPGALVASIYVLAVWVLLLQVLLRPRLRDYVLPLAGALVLAVAMTLVRYLPFALTRGLGSPAPGDQSVFSWGFVGTLFYPYGGAGIPNDITMRSLFLPVVVFALVGLVAWRAPVVRAAAASALTAVVLGLPSLPWSAAVGRLPGMNLSRFRMDDFKVFFLAAVCLLAMAGAARIIDGTPTASGRAPLRVACTRWHLAAGGALLVLSALIGAHGPFALEQWLAQWSLIVAAVVIIVIACELPRQTAGLAVLGLALLSVCSGLVAITTTSMPWRGDRVGLEQGFGAPVDDLISQRADDQVTTQRPPRADPGTGVNDARMFETRWGSAFYSGDLSLIGYVNLKGSPTSETIRAQLLDPATSDRARAFWGAPGVGLALTDGKLPDPAEIERCTRTSECGGGTTVEPISYSRATPLTYAVTASQPQTMSFNEAYYPGWQAEVCASANRCTAVAVSSGTAGELRVEVPAGRSTVTLRYETPGQTAAWIAFGVGLLGLSVWSAWAYALGRPRRTRSANHATAAPDPGRQE